MANENRLTLKIGVVYDKKEIARETKKAQEQLDKAVEDNIKKQKKQQEELRRQQDKTNKGLKEQETGFKKVATAIKGTAGQFLKFFVVAQAFLALQTQFRKAVELAFELDTAFTNFAIVSKATASEISNVNEQVDGLTLELGKLKAEVIDTVTEFSRAGFSIQESLSLAENAIKGANVGATSLENVTTFLVAGLKAFNLEAEESTRILDVLFRVANTTAINLEGIGEAFLRSANTLQTAGASLEESASLIAAANESIQDPAKVGTALKTIASRLRGVSEDGEAIPKLAESFNAVGISIQEADGSFRDIFDIFQDLARILPTLDELTRESLLEKLAGKRQKNIIIALLNNFDTAEQALKDALNSTGEVAEANEKFLESLEGRTNQLREAWNQLLTTFTDSDAIKDVVTSLKNIIVFINEFIQRAPKAIFLVGGLALAFAPFGGVVTVIGAVVSTIASVGIVSDLTKTEVEKLNDSIAELDSEIGSLEQKINNLEGVKNRTDAENRLLGIYKEQLDYKKRLKAIESEALAIEQLEEAKELIEDLVDIPVDELSLLDAGFLDYLNETEGFEETLKEQEKQLLKVITASSDLMKQVDEESVAFKTAKETFDLATEALEKNTSQQISLGFRAEKVTDEIDAQNTAISEQITLFQEVRNLTSTASEDYQLLSDALLELETNGYLTDDMLNTLISTYPDLVTQTGLAKDAFTDYVNSNKTKTLEEITRLESLAQAEIDSARARIDALKAVAQANQSAFSLVSAFKEAELSIQNAENNIALLQNERNQILATEKARKTSTETTKKEVKTLSDLELKLKNINFQIDLQQKLLERTEIPEKQIEINEELVDLYEQQREALIEQQTELEEQGKSLRKGTEEYDDYIEESYKLSLAIEDATNGIVKFKNANKELNKTFAESEIDEIAESIESLGDTINEEIQKQIDLQKQLAKDSQEYYDQLISDKEDELQALKDANDEREKQVELEELLQDLQGLRERRANILANKTARIVKDAEVGFEFIADPREIEQVNQDILDAEEAIDEFRREQKFEEDVARLESTIETLEKEAEAEQESFDTRIEELENFQDEANDVIQKGGEAQEEDIQRIQDLLLEIEMESYGVRLDEVSSFVDDYNDKIAELNAKKKEVEAIESSIKRTEASIKRSQESISASSGTGANTSTISSTESSASTSKKISGSGSSVSTSTTTVNELNVNSSASNFQDLIDDAERRMRTQF